MELTATVESASQTGQSAGADLIAVRAVKRRFCGVLSSTVGASESDWVAVDAVALRARPASYRRSATSRGEPKTRGRALPARETTRALCLMAPEMPCPAHPADGGGRPAERPRRGATLTARPPLRRGARRREATLGLGIHGRRERSSQQGGDIVLEMRRVYRPNDVRGHLRVGEGEAKDELHRSHALEHVIESCLLPALPLRTGLSSPGWSTLGRATPDDDARSRVGRGGDDRLVLPLHCRVRYLKDIEHPHRDVIREVRQGGGHADEPHLARPLE